MGNLVSEEKRMQDRERKLHIKLVGNEATRFLKYKKQLHNLSQFRVIDDYSQDAVSQRNDHHFNPNKKASKSFIKTCVSRKKKRFTNDKFDLDLAYITKRIIAMGFPSTGMESIYRNSRNDVISFLTTYHPTHYKVYNLCIEMDRYYHSSAFQNVPVSYFPMKDHNPVDMLTIFEFCIDAYLYMAQHPENVIAVHCKAGKGRTGLMISAYLVFVQAFTSADEAMHFYGERRTYNGKGVTIPSQRRYVQYFEIFLKDFFKDNYAARIPNFIRDKKVLKKIKTSMNKKVSLLSLNIGPINASYHSSLKISITDLNDTETYSKKLQPIIYKENYLNFDLTECPVQDQDFCVVVKSKKLKFCFWNNAYFMFNKKEFSRELPTQIGDRVLIGTELVKEEIDYVKPKDIPNFSVILVGTPARSASVHRKRGTTQLEEEKQG